MKNRIRSIFAVLFSVLPLFLFAQVEYISDDFALPDEDEWYNGLPRGQASIDEPMSCLVLLAVILGVAFLYYRIKRIRRA